MDRPAFAQRLVELRTEQGLSQYKLAETLGFSRGQIANYEQGSREPDHATLQQFADFFRVSVDYLLGRTDVRQLDDEGRPIPEADLDAYLRQHDLWFKGQPLTYAEKLAARQAIELLRKAMEASKEESEGEDQGGKS